MKEPRGRKRYVSLLRKRAKANLLELNRVVPKFKTSFRHQQTMRLRAKNSFQASELPRSLRSSANRNHGREVRSALHSLDSPETLTKKGKISRVSERSIDKVSSALVAENESSDRVAAAVDRRMTRGMDTNGGKRMMAMKAMSNAELKGFRGHNGPNQRKDLKWADSKSGGVLQPKLEMNSRNQLYRSISKEQDRSLKESKRELRSHEAATNAEQKSPSNLMIPAMKHNSKCARKGGSLTKMTSKLLEPQGVTTRQKASSNVRPAVEANGEANSKQGTEGNRFCDSVKQSNGDTVFGLEKKRGLGRAFNRGLQEETNDRLNHGDAHQSTHFTEELTKNSGLHGCPAISTLLRQKKTVNEMDDPREVESGKQRFPHFESHRIAAKQDPNFQDSAVKLRRSKRKRSSTHLQECTDHRAYDRAFEDGRANSDNIAVQDAAVVDQENEYTEEKFKFGHKTPEHEIDPNLDVLKVDPTSKSCLVATTPMETGGRQMRARPLDLEQPLLVLVEGFDEDYYELDGGSFHKMLQHQSECKSPISQSNSHGTDGKTSHSLDITSEKAESIVIPSFRVCVEPEDSVLLSISPYVLPESYIKADFATVENCKAEYDMDEEDDEWLEKYNQSLSPKSTISEHQFEKIIDLLENTIEDAIGVSSFTGLIEQDSSTVLEECCICNGGENSANNRVYDCDSCHILVHQSCYGIRKDSKNEKKKRKWNCKKCEAVAEYKVSADVSCSLCCRQGGALKPSNEPHRWAHVVCALYTNETYFVNPDAMEPIEGLDAAISRAKRQRRQCWLCGAREGSAERCSIPGCKTIFHVSCGVKQGAAFELQHSNNQVTSVRVYCPRHAFEVFGPPKGRLSEGEKEAFAPKHASLGNDLCAVESVCRAAKQPEISSSRWQRKGTSGQRNCHEVVKHADSRPNTGMPNNVEGTSSITDKDLMKSEQEEQVDAQCMGVDEASVKDAWRILDEDGKPIPNTINPNLMEGVYAYWISRRAKGPLLHRIQQGHAAKQFGIFNSDEDNGPAVEPVSHVTSLKFSAEDMKIVSARQQLRRLQELSVLVLQRERLKLEIFALDQHILKVVVEVLKARVFRQSCFSCKQSHSSVVCASCKKGTCMACLIKSSNHGSWRDVIKHPKFICPDCEQQKVQMHIDLSCKSYKNLEEDKWLSPSMMHAQNESNGKGAPLENSYLAAYKKPFLLLPRSDCSQQSKSATRAFWEQTDPKMVFLLDLLKESG